MSNNITISSTIPVKGRKIQIKQGLSENFTDAVLDVGEFGLLLDKNEVRIGFADGTTGVVNGAGSISTDLDAHKVLEATDTVLGHVKIGQNINVTSGTISVNNASTTTKGLVQLVDDLVTESSERALTAQQGFVLKQLIDSIATGQNIDLSAIPNATTAERGFMTTAQVAKLDTITSGANYVAVVNNTTSTSTSSALSAYQGKLINDKLEQHTNDLAIHNEDFNQYVTNRDVNGVYLTVTFKRPNTDITFMISELSNPDVNGFYQTLTWTFYKEDGVTVLSTKVWTMTYDNDGNLISKVVTS